MKEMKYEEYQMGKEILDCDKYMGMRYVILSLHTHPCAYIFINKHHYLYKKDYDTIHEMMDLNVHGGLTFSDDAIYKVIIYSDKYKCDTLQTIKYDWIIGWDYAHSNDNYGTTNWGKKWTTKEIQNEVKNVIKQIKEYKYDYYFIGDYNDD